MSLDITIIDAINARAAEQAARDAAIIAILNKILAELEKGKK